MNYIYTINDIQRRTKVSLPSLYGLIKKNKAFIEENSQRRQRRIYYNQTAMDFFISYYQPEQTAEEEKNKGAESHIFEGAEKPEKIPLESTSEDEPHKSQPGALEAEIEALKAEIGALKAQLEDKEKERKELVQQNGALILTISQLQQEKMLLLPAPKKSFTEMVRSIFKSKT